MFKSDSQFGRFLVREGKLLPDQLEKALEMQGLVGDRLGTNILDLQLMEESALLAALGQYRQTQTAAAQQLRQIPREVLRLVPPKLARRSKVVPIEKRGNTLILASTDPGDALVEDEVGMLNACLARTVLALEVRVHAALARFYRIPCPGRLAGLYRRLERSAARPALSSTVPAPSASLSIPSLPSPLSRSGSPAPPASSSPPVAPTTVPVPTAPVSTVPVPTVPVPAAPAPRAATPEAPAEKSTPKTGEIELQYIELDSASLAKLYGREEESTGTAPVPTEPAVEMPVLPEGEAEDVAATWPSDPEERLDAAAAELQHSEIRDEIGDVLLGFGEAFLKRRLLLIRRKEEIVGWRGEGRDVIADKVRRIAIKVDEPSVFLGLSQADSFWLGPVPSLAANAELLTALGSPPSACVILPVVLRSRVVCYFYGDNLIEGVGGVPLTQLKRLMAKASLAFEVYILRNKIRLL